MGIYAIGNSVRLSTGTGFFDGYGALGDPTTVTLKVRDPAGLETTYVYGPSAIVKESTGKYHFDLGPLTQSGRWLYRWIGAGAVVAAAEGRFDVQKSGFANP